MKRLLSAIFLIQFSFLFSIPNAIDTNLLGKWYKIPNEEEFNAYTSFDNRAFLNIKENNNLYTLEYTLGINYDNFINENVKMEKNGVTEYSCIITSLTNGTKYEHKLNFDLQYNKQINTWVLTFYETNQIDIYGEYVLKDPIILPYLGPDIRIQLFGYSNADGVRIRNNFGLTSSTVSTMNKNDTFQIILASKEKEKINGMLDYWYKIKKKSGEIGWVFGAFIEVDKNYRK